MLKSKDCNTLLNRVSLKCETNHSLKREFVELPIFSRRWKDLGLDDKDLLRLQKELLENPKAGTVIRNFNDIRKMRFAFENRGKSGSARIIYVDFEVHEKIFLITAFDKKEKVNLSAKEINELKQLIRILSNQLEEN